MTDTLVVYREGELLHAPKLGEHRTLCGLETAAMVREERPADWAGVWCTGCALAVVGPRRPCPARGISQR